jgi:hypothetical protein
MTPTPNLRELIERLRELHEKATPGPWSVYGNTLYIREPSPALRGAVKNLKTREGSEDESA